MSIRRSRARIMSDREMIDYLHELNDRLMETLTQMEEICRIQSGVIDNLFTLLMQHIPAESEELKGIVQDINRAAEIRKESGA